MPWPLSWIHMNTIVRHRQIWMDMDGYMARTSCSSAPPSAMPCSRESVPATRSKSFAPRRTASASWRFQVRDVAWCESPPNWSKLEKLWSWNILRISFHIFPSWVINSRNLKSVSWVPKASCHIHSTWDSWDLLDFSSSKSSSGSHPFEAQALRIAEEARLSWGQTISHLLTTETWQMSCIHLATWLNCCGMAAWRHGCANLTWAYRCHNMTPPE